MDVLTLLAVGAGLGGTLGGIAILIGAMRWGVRYTSTLRREWAELQKAHATVPELTAELERLRLLIAEATAQQARTAAQANALQEDVNVVGRETAQADKRLSDFIGGLIDNEAALIKNVAAGDEHLAQLAQRSEQLAVQVRDLYTLIDNIVTTQTDHTAAIARLIKLVDKLKRGFWPPIKAE